MRNLGRRLMHKCVRHITDIKHAPKRISCINILTPNGDNNNDLRFEWSKYAPASFKDQLYRSIKLLPVTVNFIFVILFAK